MSGVMLRRIFAAAGVAFLVSLLSGAPGSAQPSQNPGESPEAYRARVEKYYQAEAKQAAIEEEARRRRAAQINARLDALIQLNNDFFIGGSVGGMGASTKQTQGDQFTLSGPDAISGSQQDIQPGSVAGGVVVGYNGPIIDLSGFRFIPGVVGSVEWTDATGTIETIQNVGATRIATNNTFAFHRIITAGGRLTIGNLPSLLGMSGTMPFLPFVEGGEAWVNKSITWNPISGPAGVPLSSEKKTLNLASPYVGAGLTGRPFTVGFWNGLTITIQANHIFPTDNKLVPFGNPATLSQSFFVRQSINEVKASVTVPVSDFWAQGLNSGLNQRY
jgi:hypothetical protein